MSAPAASAFSLPATTTALTDAIGRERGRGVAQRVEQRDRQRIHRRPVEAQQRDAAVVMFGEHEIGHGADDASDPRTKSTSAPTGTNPAASVERIDAALPGATCAHSGSPAGTSPRAAATSRRPSPAHRGARARPRSRPPTARRARGRRSRAPPIVVGPDALDHAEAATPRRRAGARDRRRGAATAARPNRRRSSRATRRASAARGRAAPPATAATRARTAPQNSPGGHARRNLARRR